MITTLNPFFAEMNHVYYSVTEDQLVMAFWNTGNIIVNGKVYVYLGEL